MFDLRLSALFLLYSSGGQSWASGDQMKLGWENLASENCLMSNRRKLWFLVEYRAKHTVGHLKNHTK